MKIKFGGYVANVNYDAESDMYTGKVKGHEDVIIEGYDKEACFEELRYLVEEGLI